MGKLEHRPMFDTRIPHTPAADLIVLINMFGCAVASESHVLQDTFQVQFVINDDVSGMVDNNKNRDYELPLLSPPSEDQVTESRAERIKSWEMQIRQVRVPIRQVRVPIYQVSVPIMRCAGSNNGAAVLLCLK